ncbi:MAG: ABC transporter permease [Erysipelotrichia bacterium]|nr:ABC transporter permease [Erysipelotrichia bacterium]
MFLLKQLYYQRKFHLLTLLANSVAIFLLLSVQTFSDYLLEQLQQQLESLAIGVETIQIINNNVSDKNIEMFFSDKGIDEFYHFNLKEFGDYNLVNCDNIAEIFDFNYYMGYFFSDYQIKYNDNVVVLGYQLYESYSYPQIGDFITINGASFKLIGVLKSDTSNLYFNADKCVFFPNGYDFGNMKRQYFFRSEIVVEESDLEYYLNNNDYLLVSQKESQKSFEIMGSLIKNILLSLSFIAVIVAFIGIINNSLSNIDLRKQEIGIKKAMGATDKDIYKQFLSEVVLIILLSLLLSLTALYLVLFLMKVTLSWTIIPNWDNCGDLLFAVVLLGAICGIYPAIKAGKVSIISAIRH